MAVVGLDVGGADIVNEPSVAISQSYVREGNSTWPLNEMVDPLPESKFDTHTLNKPIPSNSSDPSLDFE